MNFLLATDNNTPTSFILPIVIAVISGLIVAFISFLCRRFIGDKIFKNSTKAHANYDNAPLAKTEKPITTSDYKGKRLPNKRRLKLLIFLFVALLFIFFLLSFASYSFPYTTIVFANNDIELGELIRYIAVIVIPILIVVLLVLMYKADKINQIVFEDINLVDGINLRLPIIFSLSSVAFIAAQILYILMLFLFTPSVAISYLVLMALFIILTRYLDFRVYTSIKRTHRSFSYDFNSIRYIIGSSCSFCLPPLCYFSDLPISLTFAISLPISILVVLSILLPYFRALRVLTPFNNFVLTLNPPANSPKFHKYFGWSSVTPYFENIGWFLDDVVVTNYLEKSHNIEIPITFPEDSENYERRLFIIIIDTDAFYGHYELQKITIPKSIEEIRKGAFADCENLNEIIYQGTIKEWLAIKKQEQWDYNTGEYIVHCTDGDLNKDGTEIFSDDNDTSNNHI